MDTESFYTAIQRPYSHQYAPILRCRHHDEAARDGRRGRAALLLNSAIGVWYFRTATNEDRLDLLPFPRNPRRARGSWRWPARRWPRAHAIPHRDRRRRDRGAPAGGRAG